MIMGGRWNGKAAAQRAMLQVALTPLFRNPNHDAEQRVYFAHPKGSLIATYKATGSMELAVPVIRHQWVWIDDVEVERDARTGASK